MSERKNEFEARVMSAAEAAGMQPFRPLATYDPDGDCLEFLARPDSFYAERIDDLVTVYYSHDTGEIVGSLIKNVAALQREILASHPGFRITVEDGMVRLEHIFLARLWSTPFQPGDIKGLTYKKLAEIAEEADAEADLPAYT